MSFKSFIKQMGTYVKDNVGNVLDSTIAKYTGAHLTGAEKEANAFNAEQAQINRQFQKEQADTTYQRTVADLQAAGLNPALAMNNGASVPTPTGNAASSVSPQSSGLLDLILQMKQLHIAEKANDADVRLKNAHAAKAEQELPWIDRLNSIIEGKGVEEITNLQQARQNLKAEYDLKIKQAETEAQKRLLTQAQTRVAEANANQIETMLEFDKAYRQAQTETEKAQCAFAKLQYMYNSKLWDDEYINAIKKTAMEQADDAEMKKDIDRCTRDILSGGWIDVTDDMSKTEKWFAKFLNMFMATVAVAK